MMLRNFRCRFLELLELLLLLMLSPEAEDVVLCMPIMESRTCRVKCSSGVSGMGRTAFQ